jgi:hypothetical protein
MDNVIILIVAEEDNATTGGQLQCGDIDRREHILEHSSNNWMLLQIVEHDQRGVIQVSISTNRSLPRSPQINAKGI